MIIASNPNNDESNAIKKVLLVLFAFWHERSRSMLSLVDGNSPDTYEQH
jgi:hypothetical protein